MAAVNKVIPPGPRSGMIRVPSSKSMAHRYLIAAALGAHPVTLHVNGISRDIEATMRCLQELGAAIRYEEDKICIDPIREVGKGERILPCAESGSTLRLLLPVTGALGMEAAFVMEGRLSVRPMEEYEQELMRHGMQIRRGSDVLHCSGRLECGSYSLPGNISSQYFSGLMFALPLLEDASRLQIEGRLESSGYVQMTEAVLARSGIVLEHVPDGFRIPGRQAFAMPEDAVVEGDYSSAAFFLCMAAACGCEITVDNLLPDSLQGDRQVIGILQQFGARTQVDGNRVTVRGGELKGIDIDASMIPDLIPALSVVAAVAQGTTRIRNAQRLRMKESDRIHSTMQMLQSLGGMVTETPDGLLIRGLPGLRGGTVDSCNDHRIAMSAAAAACVCREEVQVLGAECVEKSYPAFWEDFEHLRSRKGPEKGELS